MKCPQCGSANFFVRKQCRQCGTNLKPSPRDSASPTQPTDDGFDTLGFAIGMATGVPLSPAHGFSTGALLGAALHSDPAAAQHHVIDDPTPAAPTPEPTPSYSAPDPAPSYSAPEPAPSYSAPDSTPSYDSGSSSSYDSGSSSSFDSGPSSSFDSGPSF
jgi:hypothetical protein